MSKDSLTLLLGDTLNDRRRDIWLWHALKNHHTDLGALEAASPFMREQIASHLNTNKFLRESIQNDLARSLLPEKSFEWLNEGRRQIEWVCTKAKAETNYNWVTNLYGMDLLLFIFDIWQADKTKKQLTLNAIKKQWELHRKSDKQLNWFKDDNQKSVLAWDWLQANTPHLVAMWPPFENHEDTLIFFDRENLTPEQKELYIGKIKKKWSQQKYRDQLKGKAQYNFVLSDKSAKILNTLSKRYEISRARVIELLLEMEEIKNDHIEEKIRISKILN